MPLSNDTNTDSDELELKVQATEEAESGGDQDATKTEQTEVMALDEQEQVAKPTPAEISAQNQLEAWHAKILAGKADITAAPTWMQPKLMEKLQVKEKEPEIEKLIEEKLQKEREEIQFKNMVEALPELPREKAEELKSHFKELRPLGKVKALELAKKLAGLDEELREAEERGIARGRMSLPASGQPAPKPKNVLDIAKDQKAWEQFRKSGYGF